jgi:xylose isomerase
LYLRPKSYEIVHLLESITLILIFVSVKAHFEFMEKLGVDRWCFHDRDIAPDGKTLAV